MKMSINEKGKTIWYILTSVLSIGFLVAKDLFCHWIKYIAHLQFTSPYMELWLYLMIWIPVLVAVLLFVKLLLQKNVSRKVSLIVNLILTVFMVCMICFLYPGGKLMLILETYRVTSFVFVLQICALGYDLFFRKEKVRI